MIEKLIEAAIAAGDEYGAEIYARASGGDQDALREAQDAWDDDLYGIRDNE